VFPQAPGTTRWNFAARTAVIGLASCAALVAAAAPAVAAGSPDAAARPARTQHVVSGFAGSKWGDATADIVSKDAYGKNAAQQDPGSLYTVEKAIDARAVWGKKDKLGRNITGQGVGVAVLDSGVTRVPGLDGSGKVTYGPDLSVEGNGTLADQDTFGHGTFMANIIAGRAATNPSKDLSSAPANVQLGVAPDASLLALKLATTDGGTDVSQVIAALDWVTQHPVMPDGTRVRVINLSYGTNSNQVYTADPLAAAAENAWKHGIVVVTSAGNDGNTAPVTDPADDPYVLAVGAADSNDRIDGWSGDHATVASFSAGGSGVRGPDLLAPGTSLVSSRDPGSYIDSNNPQGRVSGDTSNRLFRGSGTSQAAAVVSGAASLLLQAFPTLTPDQVKYALVSSADTLRSAPNSSVAGAGMIDLNGAFDVASQIAFVDKFAPALVASAVQHFPASTGQGSLDAARGDSALVDADGNPITGEVDVQGQPWDPAAWWAATSTLTAWDGGSWLGETWTGDGWVADSTGLASARWASARWASARWASANWDDASWTSARWASARWASARWASARWAADNW
jgi:serine protease AprX